MSKKQLGVIVLGLLLPLLTPSIALSASTVNTGNIIDIGLTATQCVGSSAAKLLVSSGEDCPVSFKNGVRLTGHHTEIFNGVAFANGVNHAYTFGQVYSVIPICVASQSVAATATGGLVISITSITSVTITNNTGTAQEPRVICEGF